MILLLKIGLTTNPKAKIGIAVMLILVVISAAFIIFQPKEEEPNDDVAPPFIMVNNQLYWVHSEKAAEAPDESEISGRILSYVYPNEAPTQNDETNRIYCVNQPYAFTDNGLLVYAIQVRIANSPDRGRVDAWFYCEPYN